MELLDQQYLLQAKPFLDKLQQIDPANYDARIQRALWHFVVNRDIDSAKKEINKCKSIRYNVAWRYSNAFLMAYEGNLDKAVTEYKQAFKGHTEISVLNGVVDFMDWITEKEPEKIQLLFCLGLIHYLKVDSHLRALEAFTDFVNSPDAKRFAKQRRLAEKYIDEIKRMDSRL